MSLFGVLFVVLVVLKLAEVGAVAAWSWWWVCSPLWAPWLVVGAIGLMAYCGSCVSDWRKTRRALARAMKE